MICLAVPDKERRVGPFSVRIASVSRTRKAYELKFRALLARVGARRLEQGVRWLTGAAHHVAERDHVALSEALARVYQTTFRKTERSADSSKKRPTGPVRFLCDAGLGGLARWLRAAGYEADWSADIADDELVREGRQREVTVLTTDSLLMERRVFRDGEVPSVWVPPSLKPLQQLALVFEELRLAPRETRCMTCGGRLQSVDKEAVRDRIPPRTYRWLDEYFVCQRCGQLFWHGTHWQRIRAGLERLKTPE